MIYSGVFMTILYGADLLCRAQSMQWLLQHAPLTLAALLGAAVFPLAKTIIETFDGSPAFCAASGRAMGNHRCIPAAWWSAWAWAMRFSSALAQDMLARVAFGFAVGMAAFAGVSLLRDGGYAMRRRGRLQWRLYLVESLWGGLIGAAAGFYLDAAQVSLVVDKFHRYLSAGATAEPFGATPS